MCDSLVIILLVLISRHTHILVSFFNFKFLYWEEDQLGLVLVTRGLFFLGL